MSDLESLDKKVSECLMLLHMLVEREKDDPEFCIDLGINYGLMGLFDKAYDCLSRAAELDPENPDVHYNLGVLYSKVFFKDISKEEYWESLTDDELAYEIAVKEFRTAIDLDPEFVSAYNDLGILFKMRHNEEDAKLMLTRSLELDPDQEDIKEELEELK